MKKTLGHKRITSLALSLLLLLSAAPAALTASAEETADMTPIEQINYYGDFEKGEYKTIQFSDFDTEITDELAYTGTHSVKATATGWGSVLLNLNLEPLTTYRFSMAVYVGTENAPPAGGKFQVDDRTNWQIISKYENIQYKKDAWKHITYSFTTSEEKAYDGFRYKITFSNIKAGSVLYFDDVVFEKVTGAKEIALENAGFEDLDAGLAAWSSESVLEITDETAKPGNYSAYVYGAESDPESGVVAYNTATVQQFAVEKNTDYVLGYWAICKDSGNSPLVKILNQSNANLTGLQDWQMQMNAGKTRTEWNYNTITFNSGNNDLLKLFIQATRHGAWIDDISIKKALTANVSATGLGSAAASKTAFVTGDEITLTATPADGAVFGGWYDGETLISTDAVYTFAPTDSFSYTARFTEINGDVPEVKNAGFEENDLSAWSSSTPIEIIGTDSHSGSSSLRIKANGEVAQWSFSKIGVYVTPNTDYVLHFYGKRETQNSYSLVKILGSTNSDEIVNNNQGVNGLVTGYDKDGKQVFDHTQWGLNEITFNSGNRNYINISFTVSKDASYVDDIYLARKVGTYKSENTEYGTVKGTAPTLCYGEEFTLTAEPNDGCEFTGWYNSADELVSESPEYTNTLTSNESYVAKFAQKAPVSGDIDGDGEVNAQDLTLLRKVLLGAETSENADVNGDGNTDILDLIALKKMLVK